MFKKLYFKKREESLGSKIYISKKREGVWVQGSMFKKKFILEETVREKQRIEQWTTFLTDE
eukprot:snap_masked-scaffold_52-processed-gene-0.20-mRNA-1 protein AED:1.00 eAED:1.00 QI:0/0/0/0/1/1/2/0/60